MTRLFISHSSKDNVAAKAFKQWLGVSGWPDEDVFLDVDDIGAGERWKEALRNATFRCEAIILLASPDALASPECLAEIRKGEDYGKKIIVVLLHDLRIDDGRLESYKDRQIVDLAAAPLNHLEVVDYRDERHEVHFNATALAKVRDYLVKMGITPDRFAWPPPSRPDADPFPGLGHFTEDDAGIFFGRDADILRGLDKLRVTRRNGRPRTFVIQAASGAGKSSYLRAGLWPRLERDPDFTPIAVVRPARGILTGPDGLGRKLAARLSRPDRPLNPGDIHRQLMAPDAAQASADFRRLVLDVVSGALAQRRIGDERAAAPAFVFGIDQAEELFGAEDAAENERFILLLSELLLSPPQSVEPFAIFAIRADSAIRLVEMLSSHGIEASETLPLLPLPRTSYRDIILKPLDLLAHRGVKLTITPELAEQLAHDSAGADALPLLAFTLSSLYKDFGATGVIGLDQYRAIGEVAGCIRLALKRAVSNPGDSPAIPAANEAQLACLRAAFIPWLARISPETGLAVRRVARLDEFSGEPLAMVKRLIAARLLVADQRDGVDVVEIAHESLLRQWPDLTEWLRLDGENLRIVEGVELAAKQWAKGEERRSELLEHRGGRLRTAERLAKRDDFRKRLSADGLAYLAACRASEQSRTVRFGSIVASLLVLILAGILAWLYQSQIADRLYWFGDVRPYVLTASQEGGLKHLDAFAECSGCPPMVALAGGTFEMGTDQKQAEGARENPARTVRIGEFAVGQTPVTYDQFGLCIAHGGCNPEISSKTRGKWPAVDLTWDDARDYAAWLAGITGKPYRLLSEAEYEYAERAGSTARYPWGDSIGTGHANCADCGNRPAEQGATAVDAFPPNAFGLRDMDGNVVQWVADCFHDGYRNAPPDGRVWDTRGCTRRVVRGASFFTRAALMRSTWRDWRDMDTRSDEVGFRIARSLVR